MFMATSCSSLLSGFFSLFFLVFLHLGGCCFSPGPAGQQQDDVEYQQDDHPKSSSKRRKISPLSFSPSSSLASANPDARRHRSPSAFTSSIRSYLRRVFSSSSSAAQQHDNGEASCTAQPPPVPQPLPAPFSPSPSLTPSPLSPCSLITSPLLSPSILAQGHKLPAETTTAASTRIATAARLSSRSSFTSRFDIFPCKVCGEVFSQAHLLELHQAMKHSLSELSDVDSSMNIVRMIFLSGWKQGIAAPVIRRILRIHHNQRSSLARFEEYRDLVRSRAARRGAAAGDMGPQERCIADGNERLRFYCSTMLCSLGAGVCASPYCCTCTILRHGFAGKQADLDGIATYASGWAAHASLPKELEREFAFLQVRRAMLVCRVVAGRVGRGGVEEKVEKGEAAAFDSMVQAGRSVGEEEEEEDVELLVFNPRALLPCFVIIYGCTP